MFSAKCLPITDTSNQWPYCPSVAAALVFTLLFLLATLAHIYQACRHRQLFCLVIVTGAAWETAAFALRILSARHPTRKGVYDGSFLLVLLAPVCINAFDYMIISRLTRTLLGGCRVGGMRGSWMGKIFVCCDIVSFIVQIGGGLMSLSHKASTAKRGLHIVTGGVVFQQTLILYFLILTLRLASKLKVVMPKNSLTLRVTKRQIHAVQASLALITYRIVYRIIEFSSGQGSSLNTYISHHEWCMYVFDALPMLLAVVTVSLWHPGKLLR